METDKSKDNLIIVSIMAVVGHFFIVTLLLIQIFLIYIGIILALSAVNLMYQLLFGVIVLSLTLGAVALIKSIFISLRYQPDGIEVDRSAPIWADTIELCEAIQCPIPNKILIDDEFNASAGIERSLWPWSQKPFITIGLPLAATLTKMELKAVLAHELGHHSKKHANVSSWIYRVRMSWYGTENALGHMPEFIGRIAGYFYQWFIPLFQEKSFSISRKCEYEADEIASQTVGAQHMISALCRMDIADSQLHDVFWPKIESLSVSNKKPPKNIFFHMIKSLQNLSSEDYIQAFKAIDFEKTTESDTHPCIKDRAKSLNQKIICPEPNQQPAVTLLGAQFKDICTTLSDEWALKSEHCWELGHQEELEISKELETLTQRYNSGDLSNAEVRALAGIHSHRNQHKKAYMLVSKLYKQFQLSFDKLLMAYYLNNFDEHKEKARQIAHDFLGQNPILDNMALQILIESETEPSNIAKFEKQRLLAIEAHDEMIEYKEKFLGLVDKPRKLSAAELSDSDLSHLLDIFKGLPKIKKVTLVELPRYEVYPNCPNYLIMFENSMGSDAYELQEQLAEQIMLSQGVYVVEPFEDELTLYLYTMKVKGSVIYKK